MDEIVRNLGDGPDYAPHWRSLVVQQYLETVGADLGSAARLQEILYSERDPFVRQFLRFRHNGKAVNVEAFRYALGCQARNSATGAASLIKAMLVADRTPTEIAEELGTGVQNIVTFAKIFFDVRRYLGNESFLRRVCLSEPGPGVSQAEALRERRWLSAAYHRGWPGVEQVVLHRTPATPSEIEALSRQLQTRLASRALEFVEGLDNEEVPASDQDLERHHASRAMLIGQPSGPPDQQKTVSIFIRGIHNTLLEKAEGNPDNPLLAQLLELEKSGVKAASDAVVRRRTRFSDE